MSAVIGLRGSAGRMSGSWSPLMNGVAAAGGAGGEMDVDALRAHLRTHGQEHLLAHWSSLDDAQRQLLLEDLTATDVAQVVTYFKRCMAPAEANGGVDKGPQPPPPEVVGSAVTGDDETLKRYEQRGLAAVAAGEVAVLLLAGGQGTRLGVPYPKGMYDVGLPSRKSLYQLQAERIRAVERLATQRCGGSGVVRWYIMTSEHTKEPTQQFFVQHAYFGLKPEHVVFFEQDLLPCVGFDGRILLEQKHKIARAPDGNGGLYRALARQGVLQSIQQHGVLYLHVYCVDNILVKMADPVFMGFCLEREAQCGAKVVEKSQPHEAVGVVCKVNGVYQVVEYSEISTSDAEKRNDDGRLTFNAGNICNHFFTRSFLEMAVKDREDELQHHVAKKKITHVNDEGVQVKPDKPNGIKMEKFVFDVFKFASNFAVWEVRREDEFSPLKNADGAAKDTPTTSRRDLMNFHLRQLQKAGAKPDLSECGLEDFICEVSPLVSYSGEGLEMYAGQTLKSPFYLQTD